MEDSIGSHQLVAIDLDIMGRALSDYHQGFTSQITVVLHVNRAWTEKMPLAPFYRSESELSALDAFALSLCNGRILDVGAGVGSISLILQGHGFDVVAVESSPSMAAVMDNRGVDKVWEGDIMEFNEGPFDTILMLMNGLGVAGKRELLPAFLNHISTLLSPNGQILLDSSDLTYLSKKGIKSDSGVWEINYCYEYQGLLGEPFWWLYLDAQSLGTLASDLGWQSQIVFEDKDGQYLARLIKS